MPTRHQLTTEERRRGALAAAAVKRQKRQAAEKIVAERRAEKKLNRQRNWEAPGYVPHPLRVAKNERDPPPIEPPVYSRSCAEHGVYGCRECS